MKPRFILLSCYLFCFFYSAGQDSLPPVYELKADSSVSRVDDRYWLMLEDPSGKLELDDVLNPSVDARFHKNDTKGRGVGYEAVKHYWQLIRILNSSGKEQRLVFGDDDDNMRLELHVIRPSGEKQTIENGWGIPFSQRDSFPTRKAVPVSIAAGEEVRLYLHHELFWQNYWPELTLGFKTYDDFIRSSYIQEEKFVGDTRAAFIAGLLILGFFLNFFFYWISKEKVYLYYSLLLLGEGIWYLTLGTRLFFKENPRLLPHFDLVVTYGFFFFCVTQFVRYFLKTFIYFKRWDRLLIVLMIINLGLQFNRAIWEPYLVRDWKVIVGGIQNLVFFFHMLAVLLTFFLPKREKDRFTGLAVIAAVPVFCIWSFGYGIENVHTFRELWAGIAKPQWILWLDDNISVIEMFFVAWFAVLFTWILLQRYAILRKQFTQQALEKEREKTELIEQQKLELEKQVDLRTAELKQSIENLKATQQQLVQSEKMASLGELTAGIAHEIQNPLNFVNNFSEVNKELLAEMRAELDAGNIEEAKKISHDIEDNEEKVISHGKRADAIVKNMLQHSRTSSGTREPTDINALAEEYLRLSYHGLRARDKTFNASFETELDPGVGKLEVSSQEIGRVLLNLINNAFYAVVEKKKTNPDPSYNPTVTVQTKKENDKVVIVVTDNGIGMPKRILDKIFQPFFTTKPAGEGTGLGLSLAYDTIVNGHGGDLQVKTTEGEGTSFFITLPLERHD